MGTKIARAAGAEIASITELVIEPAVEGKGRSFRAHLLAQVRADSLWPGGGTDTGVVTRPVWAMLAASESEARAFMANLAQGRKALRPRGDRYDRAAQPGIELLRSAGYRYSWQRESEGVLITAYQAELFTLDTGMVDPEGIRFVVLPPVDWAARQAIDVAEPVRHARRCKVPLPMDELAALVPTAYLFAAYLDRRTRAPLPSDGRFYLQLLCACLGAGLATWNTEGLREPRDDEERPFGRHRKLRFVEQGTAAVGLLPGVAFQAKHQVLEQLLAEEVARYFRLTRST